VAVASISYQHMFCVELCDAVNGDAVNGGRRLMVELDRNGSEGDADGQRGWRRGHAAESVVRCAVQKSVSCMVQTVTPKAHSDCGLSERGVLEVVLGEMCVEE